MGAKQNAWAKRRIKELRDEFGGKCDTCGSTEQLEFAHIAPTPLAGKGRGRNHRIHDISKHRDCYRLMCRKCHVLFDSEREQKERLKC